MKSWEHQLCVDAGYSLLLPPLSFLLCVCASGGGIRKQGSRRRQGGGGQQARRKPTIVTVSSRLRKSGRKGVTSAAAAAAGAVVTPRQLAAARLGKARRQSGGGSGGGRSSGGTATAMRSSLLKPSTTTEDGAEAGDIDGLCAAFTTTRLRVQNIRVDRPTGFVRSSAELMPLPPLTDYTINLKSRSIGAHSVVTASVLPTPAPRPRKGTPEAIALAAAKANAPLSDAPCAASAPSNGKLNITSTTLGLNDDGTVDQCTIVYAPYIAYAVHSLCTLHHIP
jgi:hypothetical protein